MLRRLVTNNNRLNEGASGASEGVGGATVFSEILGRMEVHRAEIAALQEAVGSAKKTGDVALAIRSHRSNVSALEEVARRNRNKTMSSIRQVEDSYRLQIGNTRAEVARVRGLIAHVDSWVAKEKYLALLRSLQEVLELLSHRVSAVAELKGAILTIFNVIDLFCRREDGALSMADREIRQQEDARRHVEETKARIRHGLVGLLHKEDVMANNIGDLRRDLGAVLPELGNSDALFTVKISAQLAIFDNVVGMRLFDETGFLRPDVGISALNEVSISLASIMDNITNISIPFEAVDGGGAGTPETAMLVDSFENNPEIAFQLADSLNASGNFKPSDLMRIFKVSQRMSPDYRRELGSAIIRHPSFNQEIAFEMLKGRNDISEITCEIATSTVVNKRLTEALLQTAPESDVICALLENPLVQSSWWRSVVEGGLEKFISRVEGGVVEKEVQSKADLRREGMEFNEQVETLDGIFYAYFEAMSSQGYLSPQDIKLMERFARFFLETDIKVAETAGESLEWNPNFGGQIKSSDGFVHPLASFDSKKILYPLILKPGQFPFDLIKLVEREVLGGSYKWGDLQYELITLIFANEDLPEEFLTIAFRNFCLRTGWNYMCSNPSEYRKILKTLLLNTAVGSSLLKEITILPSVHGQKDIFFPLILAHPSCSEEIRAYVLQVFPDLARVKTGGLVQKISAQADKINTVYRFIGWAREAVDKILKLF